MHIDRRRFGLFAVSSLLLGALPIRALSDPDDSFSHQDQDKAHHEAHLHGSKHHEGATTQQYLSHTVKIRFRDPAIAQDDWVYDLPANGSANVLIDYKGNWQFQGSFDADQKLLLPCRVTVGIGMRTSIGKIFAVTKTLTVRKDGASWSRQGHDAIVGDLWPDVAKGHEWAYDAHAHEERPQDPPPQDGGSNGGGGDSTFTAVKDGLEKSLLGPIGFFL